MKKVIPAIFALALCLGGAAHAETGLCSQKVKSFSEDLAKKYLNILPDGELTTIEASGKNSLKVTMTSSSGDHDTRSLIVKVNGSCEITGVDSLDEELGSAF